MAKYARIFLILMIAVFTAGSIMHVSNAAAMTTKMAAGAMDSTGMGDCQDCPDGKDDMSPCDINACASPTLALVPSVEIGVPGISIVPMKRVAFGVAGRSGPPDPHPPRTILLN